MHINVCIHVVVNTYTYHTTCICTHTCNILTVHVYPYMLVYLWNIGAYIWHPLFYTCIYCVSGSLMNPHALKVPSMRARMALIFASSGWTSALCSLIAQCIRFIYCGDSGCGKALGSKKYSVTCSDRQSTKLAPTTIPNRGDKLVELVAEIFNQGMLCQCVLSKPKHRCIVHLKGPRRRGDHTFLGH